VRDRTLQTDLEPAGTSRPHLVHERVDPVIHAALDLQRRAGNRSVVELVRRSGAAPGLSPLATLAGHGRGPAAGSDGGAVAVQRKPCVDCPDAANAPGPASDLMIDQATDPSVAG
jgi:hypothetical protein